MAVYDPNLKTFVTSERHREKLLTERGMADVRNWNSPENIKKEAERNLAEWREKLNAPIKEAIVKALHDAESGADFTAELEARLEADARRKEEEADRALQLRRENEEEDRRRWERDHGR